MLRRLLLASPAPPTYGHPNSYFLLLDCQDLEVLRVRVSRHAGIKGRIRNAFQ
jgi:hypothetical protein